MRSKTPLIGLILASLLFVHASTQPVDGGMFRIYRKMYRLGHPRDGHIFFGLLDRISPFIPDLIGSGTKKDLASADVSSLESKVSEAKSAVDASHKAVDETERTIGSASKRLKDNPSPYLTTIDPPLVTGPVVPPPIVPSSGSKKNSIAVSIGMEFISSGAYGGPQPSLPGTKNDVEVIRKITSDNKFDSFVPLFNEEGSIQRVKAEIKKAASELNEGGLFVFHYSGHGFPSTNLVNQPNNQSFAYCLFDGMMLDYELAQECWTLFPKNSRVFVITDACFSFDSAKKLQLEEMQKKMREKNANPTAVQEACKDKSAGKRTPIVRTIDPHDIKVVARTLPYLNRPKVVAAYKARQTAPVRIANPNLACSVYNISACTADQTATDLGEYGLFTMTIKEVWESNAGTDGESKLTFKQFFEGTQKQMAEDIAYYSIPNPQNPTDVTGIGAPVSGFPDAQPAFKP